MVYTIYVLCNNSLISPKSSSFPSFFSFLLNMLTLPCILYSPSLSRAVTLADNYLLPTWYAVSLHASPIALSGVGDGVA